MRKSGRGRLSAIDLLPSECDPIIADAAAALAAREQTQLEIYRQFKERLIALQGETGIGFDIPSFSAFNRYSLRLATMTRRLEQTREIAATISERFDAEASDDLTLVAAEAIKTLIFEILNNNEGLQPKAAQELAQALKAALAAQHISTARRQKLEQSFAEQTSKAVEAAVKEAGLSADTARAIRNKVLGVRPQKEPKA